MLPLHPQIHHGLPYTFLREFHHRLKLHEYIPKILPPNVAPYDMVNVSRVPLRSTSKSPTYNPSNPHTNR